LVCRHLAANPKISLLCVLRDSAVKLQNPVELRGWLFDLYPLDASMILWIKGEDGVFHRLEEPSGRDSTHRGGKRTFYPSSIP